MTSTARTLAAVLSIACAPLLLGTDFSSYRGFQFGANLAAAAKKAGVNPSEATFVSQRPAVIQQLEWRPGYSHTVDSSKADPVREGLLRFYNGALFQIVTTYAPEKIEGLTDADMVEVISRTYGSATKPGVEVPYHSSYGEVGLVIARWEDPEYSYDLVRTGNRMSFALILSSKRLTVLAEAALAESHRLDVVEAPQRAIDTQKKQETDNRLLLDKARSANLLNFRP